MSPDTSIRKVALVTGAAARIGAGITRHLHSQGFNIALHYHKSTKEADALCQDLNKTVENSAVCFKADLLDVADLKLLAEKVQLHWGRLDVLVNNASSFYPTPLAEINAQQWQDLMGTNALAPALLCKANAAALQKTQGCIINITDIAADTGRKNYLFYTMAKAGLATLTKSLARELAPTIRVNAIAPGDILPPNFTATQTESGEHEPAPLSDLSNGCLNYPGTIADIAFAVSFLIQSTYISGQTLSVDGGKKLLG